MNKIKSILIIFALFAISISIKGQSEIGIKIGIGIPYYEPTFNHIVFLKPESFNNNEVFYNKGIDKILKLGVSLAYQKHEFNSSSLILGNDYSIYSNYDYSLKYFFIKLYPQLTFGDKVIFVIQFGPTLSKIIKGHEIGTTTTSRNFRKTVKSYDGDVKHSLFKGGFGVFSSIGVELKVEKIAISPSIQYQYSMNSLRGASVHYKERSILFNLGISYNFESK